MVCFGLVPSLTLAPRGVGVAPASTLRVLLGPPARRPHCLAERRTLHHHLSCQSIAHMGLHQEETIKLLGGSTAPKPAGRLRWGRRRRQRPQAHHRRTLRLLACLPLLPDGVAEGRRAGRGAGVRLRGWWVVVVSRRGPAAGAWTTSRVAHAPHTHTHAPRSGRGGHGDPRSTLAREPRAGSSRVPRQLWLFGELTTWLTVG